MSDGGGLSKADMLAAAKRKLKDYESKRNRDSPTSSVISSEPAGGMNGRSSGISEEESVSSNLHNGVKIASISPFQQTMTNGNEWYQAYAQLKTQHDELVSHYAQLHSAYSQVNENGVHIDAENQIVQLQAALSTMVEEKLACQTELRQCKEAMENLKKKHTEESVKKAEVPKNDEESFEVKSLLARIAEKDALLFARHGELENIRKENSNIQANLLSVQHERSEAQARVKSLVRENSQLEQIIQQCRKDIQMKDLNLKQLGGAHNLANVSNENTPHDEKYEIELIELRNERSRLLAEVAALKSHYLEREQALQQKQIELAAQLEQVQNQRFSSDDRIQTLEHQLHWANAEVEKLRAASIPTQSVEESIQIITEEEVVKRIREAIHAETRKWEKKLEDEQTHREEEILDKDRIIFEREQSLAEVEMKYRLLEERTLETTTNGADLLSLSEQLQNEKATVSRAVAQNRELKSQLIETEDRLIALTEEKAKIELEKQSAEHQVKELIKQLNLESAGLVTNISEVIASQPHLNSETPRDENNSLNKNSSDDSIAEFVAKIQSLELENANLRGNLENSSAALQQVRADLRRSNTQNEQMDEIMRQNAEDENQNSIHVELTQAIGRVNDLAAENEQLREAINDLSVQLNEERSRVVESEKKLDEIERNRKDENEKPKESKELNQEDLWAHKELEKRFARAMLQNAELSESIDRLEHINQQLELENDTIADHVILYQHQRKLIRERLRVKDEQLRTMEEDRTRTVARCQELQNVLMTVLNKGGILKEYETNSLARKAARRLSRSYSHSTVDELSGDEDMIVDAKMEEIPSRSLDHANIHGQKANHSKQEIVETETGAVSPARSLSPLLEGSPLEQDASVRRILEIISDISRPQPVLNGQLHCTQCIGDLQEL
ncbi:unnamed protein product [Caenorhabditis angaria]|uniref:Golgin subfamily A conserved domain-containing protein n=1 Tax=Caenorhabditis angaria TaxID=860376 RepID=A0A9P1IBH4_9PELO|nr:unnamed protein product [Caenorhabditis angaria]